MENYPLEIGRRTNYSPLPLSSHEAEVEDSGGRMREVHPSTRITMPYHKDDLARFTAAGSTSLPSLPSFSVARGYLLP